MSKKMRIIGVLDVQGGLVVHGRGGKRQDYRPLVSRLVASPHPRAVAQALRQHFNINELYIADLDAIAGRPPAWETLADLQAQGFRLWVDAGLRRAAQAEPLLQLGVAGIVAGLETLAGPEELALLCQRAPERLVFSLDLRAGHPLATYPCWQRATAWQIAQEVLAQGVRQLLVLDLAHVGMGQGLGTEALCRQLLRTDPELALFAGGGVRGRHDLERLRQLGLAGVLVASALHAGWLQRADLEELTKA
jgi:phosphoribosylformimino-5-aminoimidazole carboxamide ribotide isomerase